MLLSCEEKEEIIGVQDDLDIKSVGPDTFSGVGGWTEPEELQGKDIWTDSYCFVELGF